MDWRDGMQYIQGSHNYGYSSGSPYKANVSGALASFSCPVAQAQPPDPKQVAQVELDALLKVKNAKVNLGVSWGERVQTAGLFYNNAKLLADAARELRRGKLTSAMKKAGLTWRDVPTRWLEFQYGWKPLLGDIYKACDAICEADQKNQKRSWYSVSAKSSRKGTLVTRYPGGAADTVSLDSSRSDVKVRFDFGPHEGMQWAADLDQWGLLNPLEIGWELLPFSFVVDWAIPVGNFLSSLTAAVPYSFRGGSRTDWSESFVSNWLEFQQAPSGTYNHGWGVATSEGRRFRRHVYPTFPSPSISALAPHTNTAAAKTILTRCANALSIIATAFR